jgi:hypothetical protein
MMIEDPGLRIESFVVINLRGVSTNKKYRHAIPQRTYNLYILQFEKAIIHIIFEEDLKT